MLNALQKLALSLGLGLLVGLERQRAGKDVGLRTFSFTCMAGTVSWFIDPVASWLLLGFVAVMVVMINIHAMKGEQGTEATTSVALFVTALNGILVGRGELFLPIAAVVLMMLLLAWKDEMVGFTEAISRDEIHAAITLGLLAFVILPVLPHGPVDPWGLIDLRQTWLMIVLISAIGFGNYVLLKVYGVRGVTYSGFLGGLVNSTATMAKLAIRARENHRLEDVSFQGIMLAKLAMFLRNLIVLAIFASGALRYAIGPVAAAMIATVILAFRGARTGQTELQPIEVTSPFSLRAALEFGAIFLGLSVVGGLMTGAFGESALFAVSFAAGLVSSSSMAASAANLAHLQQITLRAAGLAVVVSSLASNVVIVPLVWRAAAVTGLPRRVFISTLIITLAAVVGWGLSTQIPLLSR